MVKEITTIPNDQIHLTENSGVTSYGNNVTQALSLLANFVFSSLYAVYDFPRSTNPVTQQREFRYVPTFVEQAIGTVVYPTLLKKSGRIVKETDTTYGNYSKLVHEIGRDLIAKCPRKDLSFEFEVVENNEDNAWCLPGGKIAINLGLIQNMEKEQNTFGMNRSFTLQEKIAAVLSHEITHAAARHGGRTLELRGFLLSLFKIVELTANFFMSRHYNRQIQELEKLEVRTEEQTLKIAELQKNRDSTSNTIFKIFDFVAYRWLLTHCTLCTSRSHELEADKYGMHLVHKVGSENNKVGFSKSSAESAVWLQHYFKTAHPKISIGWLGRIINFLSTHPSSEERLLANQKTWQELRTVV